MDDHIPVLKQASRSLGAFLSLLSGCLLALVLGGCGKPPVMVYKHLLEYPVPESPTQPKVPEGLKVELFSVAQAFNSPAMVYRPNSYQTETYRFHRWRVNPGSMVTDMLLRDLRRAGLFTAIFGYDSPTRPRFVLEGAVEEFQEVDEGDAWQAVLGLYVILLDTTKGEIPQRVVFQKNYRAAETLIDKTPQGLAEAMSRAMQKLSGLIVADIHQAARSTAASN